MPNPNAWREEDNHLHRRLLYRDFREAFGFKTQVALLAEKMDHHPTWTNTWNRLDIVLSTHDAGHTVTERDWKLAQAIDELYDRFYGDNGDNYAG